MKELRILRFLILLLALVALCAVLPAKAERKQRPLTTAKEIEKDYKFKFIPVTEPLFCSYAQFTTYITLVEYTIFGKLVSFDRQDEKIIKVKVGDGKPVLVSKSGTLVDIPDEGVTHKICIYRNPENNDWAFFNGECVEAKIETATIKFYDVNCDGKWFEPRVDGVMFTNCSFISPLLANITYYDWRLASVEIVGEGKKQALKVKLDPIKCYPEERQAMAVLNDFRMQMGLPVLVLDEALSRKCRLFAQFIALQGGDMADWDIVMNPAPGQIGFTPECVEVKNSIFFCFDGAVTAMQDMIGQFFHRSQFFFPDTTGFGIGADGIITVFNGELMRDPEYFKWNYPILNPAPGQTISYYEYYGKYGGETPDPRPAGAGGSHPITIQWAFQPEELVVTSWKLFNASGKKEVEVPSYCFWPGRPAHPSRADNEGQILMMANKPLGRGVKYHVIVEYTIKGNKEVKDWCFFTAKK